MSGSSIEAGNPVSGDIVIPETVYDNGDAFTVTAIGDYSFYRCTGLKSIAIPGVTEIIGNCAFRYCTGISSVIIPPSVTKVGNYAFDTSGLRKGAYPSTLAYNSFPNTTTGVKYPAEDSIIEDGCVWSVEKDTLYYVPVDVTDFEIPNSVATIGDDAFRNCKGLASVTLPPSVRTIGDRAFYDCAGLTSIEIPNEVRKLGISAFEYCRNLTEAAFGSLITEIPANAFRHCRLNRVVIPPRVESIGEWAFDDNNIEEAIMGLFVKTIGEQAFAHNDALTEISITAFKPPVISSDVFPEQDPQNPATLRFTP